MYSGKNKSIVKVVIMMLPSVSFPPFLRSGTQVDGWMGVWRGSEVSQGLFCCRSYPAKKGHVGIIGKKKFKSAIAFPLLGPFAFSHEGG